MSVGLEYPAFLFFLSFFFFNIATVDHQLVYFSSDLVFQILFSIHFINPLSPFGVLPDVQKQGPPGQVRGLERARHTGNKMAGGAGIPRPASPPAPPPAVSWPPDGRFYYIIISFYVEHKLFYTLYQGCWLLFLPTTSRLFIQSAFFTRKQKMRQDIVVIIFLFFFLTEFIPSRESIIF